MLITFHNTEIFKALQNAKYSGDELSFLHLAAKNARHSLCSHLIKKLDIGKLVVAWFPFFAGFSSKLSFKDVNIQSKSLLTPLHILVRSDLKSKKTTKIEDKNALKAENEKKVKI